MLATLLLSTGVPMITMGDELGRTQGGNNNAYCQDNEISWMNWNLQPWQSELLDFAQKAVRLRTEHRAFRQRYFFTGVPINESGQKDIAWIGSDGRELSDEAWNNPETRTIAMFLSGSLRSRDQWGRPNVGASFLVILHSGDQDQSFTMPGPPCGNTYSLELSSAQDPKPATVKTESATDRMSIIAKANETINLTSRSLSVWRVLD